MQFEFYVRCFDRNLIVELKSEKDKENAEKLMEEAYDRWCEQLEDVADSCCEEYICESLTAAGLEFEWIL